jgi:hypothetical protein
MKRDGLKATPPLHGPLALTHHPKKKASVIADFKKTRSHFMTCVTKTMSDRSKVQNMLASVGDTPLGKVTPCDMYNLANPLKLRKTCGLDGIPNECLRHLPTKPLVHLTHLINHCLRLSHLPKSLFRNDVKTTLVVSLKGLGAKTKLLAGNRQHKVTLILTMTFD